MLCYKKLVCLLISESEKEVGEEEKQKQKKKKKHFASSSVLSKTLVHVVAKEEDARVRAELVLDASLHSLLRQRQRD